jgi:anti-anti-sigma regulatory factor
MDTAVQTRWLADDHVLIQLFGAIEGECLDILRRALATTLVRHRPARLSIDLRQVTYLDPLAVGALAATGGAAADLGIEVVVIDPDPGLDAVA